MVPTTERLIERMGLHFEADGMPRIAGRMLGHLVVRPDPRSLDELAGDLHARLLEHALEHLLAA
ncbi:MAG TPA: hypothetical protein VF263_00725 [Longimicrobiaceae bacterium]